MNASVSAGLNSLPPSSSVSCSLNSLVSAGLQDTALPQSPAQQGGLPSQPSQPPGTDSTPLQGAGRRGSLQGQTAGGAEAATEVRSPSSMAPQDRTPGATPLEGKDHDTPDPSQGNSLPQEGAGPTATATGGGPGKKDAVQAPLLPGSKGDRSETRNEPQPMAPASRVSCGAEMTRVGPLCP